MRHAYDVPRLTSVYNHCVADHWQATDRINASEGMLYIELRHYHCSLILPASSGPPSSGFKKYCTSHEWLV